MISYFLYLPNLESFKTGNYSFYHTTSLSLSSMNIKVIIFISNLPNLQSFKTGDWSFSSTTSLSLSSMIIKFDYFTFSNLPKLNQISLGFRSFEETTSISLESTIEFQSFQFLDVPFNNGNYSVDNNETFHKITSSSITSDLSILFSLFYSFNFTNSI